MRAPALASSFSDGSGTLALRRGCAREGIVVMGDHRGRKLGFPTANLRIGPNVDIADGVYAGVVELEDGTNYLAAVS